MDEMLSALVDGELQPNEQVFMLELLKSDPELQARWTCYHLIRNTLREKQNKTNLLALSLAERVRVAINTNKAQTFNEPLLFKKQHTKDQQSHKA